MMRLCECSFFKLYKLKSYSKQKQEQALQGCEFLVFYYFLKAFLIGWNVRWLDVICLLNCGYQTV